MRSVDAPKATSSPGDLSKIRRRRPLVMDSIKRNAIRKDVLFFLLPWILIMTLAAVVSVWEFAGGGDPELKLAPSSILGLLFIIFGLPIILLAAATLRRSYSSTLVIREDHQLIQHGIYKHVRHPIYSGTILVLLGIPLCLASLYGFTTMVLVIPLFLNRIRIEEKLLTEEFGAEYERYRETSRKLIPYLF